MSYQDFSYFAGTFGLILLVGAFVVALGYALWPGNSERFSRAAHAPLLDDGHDDQHHGRREDKEIG